MQTFVIGWGGGSWGQGRSGLFGTHASLGCSWRSPPKDRGTEEKVEREGKGRGAGGEKDVVSNLRLQTRRQKKMGGKSAPVLFSILRSSTISIQLF